jgi:predicted PurR-regulated permease PerM
VAGLPLVGARADETWRGLAGDPESLAARLAPHVGEVTGWLAARAGNVGQAIVQFLLTVVIAGILYATGETAARGVRRFFRRLAGERGENAVVLAAQAVRAVALGIVVTALTQTVVSGVGLLAGGVPHAGLLVAVVFVLCIAQLGPMLVMAPATIWAFMNGSTGRAVVLLVFTLVAVTLDNFLRPVLIRKGADLPFILILAGVFGGLVGFGVVGLFVGPVLLAVTWTLLSSWVGELDQAEAAPSPPEA